MKKRLRRAVDGACVVRISFHAKTPVAQGFSNAYTI